MKHLRDGEIRQYLEEKQVDPSIKDHLAHCPICQDRLTGITTREQWVTNRLARTSSWPSSAQPDGRYQARPALIKFNQRINEKKETSMSKHWFHLRSKALWAAIAFILVLAIGVSFPTGRAWADQFLNLFRIQQVTVIPIDQTSLTTLNGNNTLAQQIGQLLSSSITMKTKAEKAQDVASQGSASQLAGFTVRLPSGQSTPLLTVQGGSSFDFTIDRSRAQALLNESGHSDLVLPQSIDGEVISVSIPASVTAGYGQCPDPASTDQTTGSIGRQFANCIELFQIPSPTVKAPADLNLKNLAQIGLEFTGMSAQQAEQFSQNIDWSSSLVIPIPRNAATYQTITVDGVSGTLIQRPVDDAPQYAIIWVKNGIVYTIGGMGSDTTTALQMANSLQ